MDCDESTVFTSKKQEFYKKVISNDSLIQNTRYRPILPKVKEVDIQSVVNISATSNGQLMAPFNEHIDSLLKYEIDIDDGDPIYQIEEELIIKEEDTNCCVLFPSSEDKKRTSYDCADVDSQRSLIEGNYEQYKTRILSTTHVL